MNLVKGRRIEWVIFVIWLLTVGLNHPVVMIAVYLSLLLLFVLLFLLLKFFLRATGLLSKISRLLNSPVKQMVAKALFTIIVIYLSGPLALTSASISCKRDSFFSTCWGIRMGSVFWKTIPFVVAIIWIAPLIRQRLSIKTTKDNSVNININGK